MGSTRYYYERLLQCLAHCLAFDENIKLAKELEQETDIQKLEEYILNKKKTISEKEFFYNAGRTCQGVFDDAMETGVDALNASCGGIAEFEDFIGLEPYDDEEEEEGE